VPVCADIGDQQVEFLDRPDAVMGGGGAKGLGEVGMIGLSAAIANAYYDATGTRARSLPIRMGNINEI
jgi:xanthine dehydrogenase YagR molybdenum-binding subunit